MSDNISMHQPPAGETRRCQIKDVPLNMTYLHCLQHSLFEHLFNLYFQDRAL